MYRGVHVWQLYFKSTMYMYMYECPGESAARSLKLSDKHLFKKRSIQGDRNFKNGSLFTCYVPTVYTGGEYTCRTLFVLK